MEEENVVLCGKYLTKSSAIIIDEHNCIVVKLVVKISWLVLNSNASLDNILGYWWFLELWLFHHPVF